MKMRLFFLFTAFCISTHFLFPSSLTDLQNKKETPITIGINTRMYSEILGEWRSLEIYLPEDYEVSDKSYPILVVLDGGWAFNYCVSVVDMMSPNYFPRMIVVGLPNTNRSRDLYPLYEVDNDTEKGTENFLRFMREELFPHLGKEYRTREYRILFGHSLGGLFSIYTLLKFPSLFEGYIATSPSLGIKENKDLLDNLLKSVSSQEISDKFLYFSGGGEEGEELHQGIKDFDRSLKEKRNSSLEWSFDIFAGEGHVPVKGFYKGMRELFHRWIPALEFFISGTLDDIKTHYGKLSQRFGFTVLPPTPIINVVGRRYLRENKPQMASDVYAYFVSVYPKYDSGYLALAEAYILAEKFDFAIKNLQRCLKLNPNNSRAKKLLDEIQIHFLFGSFR